MTSSEKSAYLAGVVDGLRQARWIKDKPNPDAARCIRRWFYDEGDKSSRQIDQLLKRHPSKPTETLVYLLVKKRCGWK